MAAPAPPSVAIAADVRDAMASNTRVDDDKNGAPLLKGAPKTLADIEPLALPSYAKSPASEADKKYVPPHKRGLAALPSVPIEMRVIGTASPASHLPLAHLDRQPIWDTVRQPLFANRLGERKYVTLINFSRTAKGHGSGLTDVTRFETTYRAFRGESCAGRQTSPCVLSPDESMLFKIEQTKPDGYALVPPANAADARGTTISRLIGAPRRIVAACTYDAIPAVQVAAALETGRVPIEVLKPPVPDTTTASGSGAKPDAKAAAGAAGAAAGTAAASETLGPDVSLQLFEQRLCREAQERIQTNIDTWIKDAAVEHASWFRGTKAVSAVPHPKDARSLNEALHTHFGATNDNTLMLDAPDWRSPTKPFYPGHETSYADTLQHSSVLQSCNAVVLTNRPYWPQTLGTNVLASVLKHWDLYVQRGSLSRASKTDEPDDYEAYQELIRAYDAVLAKPQDGALMLKLMDAAKTMHTAYHAQVEDKIKSAASHTELSSVELAHQVFEIGAQARPYAKCKYYFVLVRRS